MLITIGFLNKEKNDVKNHPIVWRVSKTMYYKNFSALKI